MSQNLVVFVWILALLGGGILAPGEAGAVEERVGGRLDALPTAH